MPAFGAGPLTPLLVESGSGQLAPAARGRLGEGVEGVLGHLAYTRNKAFRFSVALTEVASSTAFVPRLFCPHGPQRPRRRVLRLRGARRELVSVFAARRFGPGLVLPVHVNPEGPADFVLVW
ncbi:MAG: hypothetical protein ACOYD4_10400 [Solirubrobacterales bacterium]